MLFVFCLCLCYGLLKGLPVSRVSLFLTTFSIATPMQSKICIRSWLMLLLCLELFQVLYYIQTELPHPILMVHFMAILGYQLDWIRSQLRNEPFGRPAKGVSWKIDREDCPPHHEAVLFGDSLNLRSTAALCLSAFTYYW